MIMGEERMSLAMAKARIAELEQLVFTMWSDELEPDGLHRQLLEDVIARVNASPVQRSAVMTRHRPLAQMDHEELVDIVMTTWACGQVAPWDAVCELMERGDGFTGGDVADSAIAFMGAALAQGGHVAPDATVLDIVEAVRRLAANRD